jgi:hypothetical protein
MVSASRLGAGLPLGGRRDFVSGVPAASARTSVSRLELALDTPAQESVLPFWAAVLAVEHLSGPGFGGQVRYPADGLPTVWFQASGTRSPASAGISTCG